MTTIIPRPIKINSAENALKKSIPHFYMLTINYPSEANDCIEQLNTAIELLLRQIYEENGENTESENFESLIKKYWDWDEQEKTLVHQLRKRRNASLHEGESPWEGSTVVRYEVLETYRIAGQTYESLGYDIEQVFCREEQNILRGIEPGWKEEARILVDASLNYFQEENRDIGINLSDTAMEKAIRGFAKSWRINNADSLPIPELIKALDENEYYFSSDLPIHYDDWFSRPLTFTRDTHDECYLGEDCMNYLQSILSSQEHCSPERFNELFIIALEDRRDAVLSLIRSAPFLDYFESLVNNWLYIQDIFTSKNPGLKVPMLKEDEGICCSWYDGADIWIRFDGTREKWGWTENHETLLLEIIEDSCGMKPEDLGLSISWDFLPKRNINITLIE
jgi:hypothetical protein